jgi:hypothetical protein
VNSAVAAVIGHALPRADDLVAERFRSTVYDHQNILRRKVDVDFAGVLKKSPAALHIKRSAAGGASQGSS